MFESNFHVYFKKIKSKYEEGTEFTPRTDLENLLNEIKPDSAIRIYQDPKKKIEFGGKPDFRIEKSGLVIGYIETKTKGVPYLLQRSFRAFKKNA